MKRTEKAGVYGRVYRIAGAIPRGRVATYGQIASLVDECTARMVGYAMASIPDGVDVPWHRVINGRGEISRRGNPESESRQRALLEKEGVRFGPSGRVSIREYRWEGPDPRWLAKHGIAPVLPGGPSGAGR